MKKETERCQKTVDMFRGSTDFPECDDTPVEMPVGYKQPTSLQDFIAQAVRTAVSQETEDEFDSIEEADDFEVDSDDGLLDFSPYELTELQDEEPILETPTPIKEAPQEEAPEVPAPTPEVPGQAAG